MLYRRHALGSCIRMPLANRRFLRRGVHSVKMIRHQIGRSGAQASKAPEETEETETTLSAPRLHARRSAGTINLALKVSTFVSMSLCTPCTAASH